MYKQFVSSRKNTFSTLLLLSFGLSCMGGDKVLVTPGSVWTYDDNGKNPDASWRSVQFKDSEWKKGKAPLGYGDKGMATNIGYGGNKKRKFVTTYFRHVFKVENPGAFTYLKLGLMRDDGAVVYLNGEEVVRDGMPEGPIQSQTLASEKISTATAETRFHRHEIVGVSLLDGENVLAVEVHQSSARSSDLRFDLKLSGTDEKRQGGGLVRGPYLQLGSPTAMTIRWRTRLKAPGVVRFGATKDSLKKSAEGSVGTDHEVRLTGLKPHTTYYYSIGNGDEVLAGGDDEHFFRTSPKAGNPGPVHAWIIGDCGTGSAGARSVYEAYLKEKGDRYTDLWLMLGDNAYNSGKDKEYQRAVFDLYTDLLLQSPLWSTRGNHERSADVYYGIFTLASDAEAGGVKSGTEAYYSFDFGNIHFICLDSYDTDRSVEGDMYKWLQADLEETTQTFIVAFWHHPPYTKGSHDSDKVKDSDGRMRDMRENFLPLLEKGGVDLVLSGHSHCYERSYLLNGHNGFSNTLKPAMILDKGDGKPKAEGGDGAYRKGVKAKGANEGTVYIVAGNAGKISGGSLDHPVMFFSLNEFGSVILDSEGNRMEIRLLDRLGQIRDKFCILKGEQPPSQ